jgi:hypothetical protein
MRGYRRWSVAILLLVIGILVGVVITLRQKETLVDSPAEIGRAGIDLPIKNIPMHGR